MQLLLCNMHQNFTSPKRALIPPAARPQVELRHEARHQVEHFREKNKAALLNLLSDGARPPTVPPACPSNQGWQPQLSSTAEACAGCAVPL